MQYLVRSIAWIALFLPGFFAGEYAEAGQQATETTHCKGLAYVKPDGGLFGTIYVSYEPSQGGGFERRGYLPSGMVVRLKPTHGDWTGSEQSREYCGFTYAGVIQGHLKQSEQSSLTLLLQRLKIEASELAAFVAPAYPDTNRPLRIYNEPSETSVVDAEVQRNSFSPILLQKSDGPIERCSDGFLEVRYLPRGADPISSNLRNGFIASNDDRSCDSGGTFRLYSLEHADATNVGKTSLMKRFENFVASFLGVDPSEIGILLNNKVLSEIANLAGCKRNGAVTIRLSADAGFKTGFLGFEVDGTGALTWQFPSDEVLQFDDVGSAGQTKLSLSGVAKCKNRYPEYLEEAVVIVETAATGDRPQQFVITRDEFFSDLIRSSGLKETYLNELKELSKLSNPPGDKLHPLLVIPKKNGVEIPYYYVLFDQVERYMSSRVFENIAPEPEQEMALILLVVEALTYWRNRS